MAFGKKIIPLRGVNTDLHESLMPADLARFIKNLAYEVTDTADATGTRGSQTGVFKPLQGNALYIENLVLPEGNNMSIGTYSFREFRQVFVFVYNSLGNHTIYRLNGSNQTYDIVYQGPCLNFQLQPENFIAHEGGCWLEQTFVSDPVTGIEKSRSYLMFTDGINPQRFICVEDSIATQSFNAALFPYFGGSYDPCAMINMGLSTPADCIGITEVPVDPANATQNNKLLFTTWQFRLLEVDVWGRPTEHGIISDMYVPAGSNCITTSSALPNCLDLNFPAPPPYIDKIQIEYRNCNDEQWYLSDVLELYNGNSLGQWWLRSRNSGVNFDAGNNTITYRFCANKACDPLPVAETNRLFNPLPITSQSVAAIGSFIGLGNNVSGFLPFSQDLKDKITFTVTPPGAVTSTSNNFINISILLEIYNPFFHSNEPIYHQGISPNAYGFGAFNTGRQYRSFFAYQQWFLNTAQQGFVGYLAGTKNFVISTQWVLEPNGNFVQVTDFSNTNLLNYPYGSKFFQQFVFSNVPKGTYVFRVAAHQSDPTVDPNYQSTSAYVNGLYPFNFSNIANPVDHDHPLVLGAHELVVNVCTSAYDSRTDNKILIINDLNANTAVRAGYVQNTHDTSQTIYGIELLEVESAGIHNYTTDHNGFYFAASTTDGFSGHGFISAIYGMCNCTRFKVLDQESGYQQELKINNIRLVGDNTCPTIQDQPCQIILVKGSVYLCGSRVGVPGISVVLTRGRTAITDANGNFTLVAHDDIRNGVRIDDLYFMTASCPFKDCAGDCIVPITVVIQPCTTCTDREVTVLDTFLAYSTARGLLSGGTYPVGVVGWDKLGRPTFVEQDPGYYITIPALQQTHIFAPSTVTINIDATAIFPPDIAYLTFWIGPETTIATYITWIVDNVQFIDNTGQVNTVAPTQIKIYYASLIEYNKQNNYNTTVNWNFIVANGTTPVTTDQVEFLLNGDGSFFPKSITALIKYDQTGQYFLINYTSDLAGLLPNAIIRLIRPKQCTGTEPYFEICSPVRIINGKAQISSLILNAFDTYYVNRQIPVPTLQPNSSPPVLINEPRTFGVPFETNSPSDFWGQGCNNIGRVNTKNPYETVIYTPDQVSLSGALSPNGQLNFLNYFDEANMISFSDTGLNGITAILPETSTVLLIGQSDNCVVGFNDNIVRINPQGQAIAGSIQNQFGQPERKVGSNYGCQLRDKNTIYKKEGLVQYLDASKAVLVQHNYQTAIPLSNNGMEGLLRAKIKAVQQFNTTSNNTRYFSGIINPINHEYLLTDYIIGSNNFINPLRDYSVDVSETYAWDVFGKVFKGTYSFTPEGYAELEGELNDQQLFSFTGAIPYRHYTTGVPLTFNTFYGVVCERILEVVLVMDNLKKKKPLALAEYCKQGAYFCDRVLTETGQLSRILLAYFLQAEYGWYAPFLCDLNTPPDPNRPLQTGVNVLLDGNMLTGTWIKIRLVGDPAVNTVYSELQGISIEVFPSEKSGI
jgi:hypothetical protein